MEWDFTGNIARIGTEYEILEIWGEERESYLTCAKRLVQLMILQAWCVYYRFYPSLVCLIPRRIRSNRDCTAARLATWVFNNQHTRKSTSVQWGNSNSQKKSRENPVPL